MYDVSETVAGLRQNKEKLSVTVSKKVKDDYEKLGNALEYGGLSNVVETALNFYLGALYKENEIKVKQLQEELTALKDEYDSKLKLSEAEHKKDRDILFSLLTNHSELIPEYNELKESVSKPKETFKIIKF